MAGKLKGVIPAQTPKGVRKDNVSISLAFKTLSDYFNIYFNLFLF